MIRAGAMLMLFGICLCGCGDGGRRRQVEDASSATYAEGYRRGASDAVGSIERKAEEARVETLKSVRPKLLWGALAAAVMTLVGDTLAERGRKALAAGFKLEPSQQADLAALSFWMCVIAATVFLYSRYGLAPLPATAILLGTAAVHLHDSYIPALLSGEKSKRSIALGKLKSLLFLVLVVGMVFELLSDRGTMAFGVR